MTKQTQQNTQTKRSRAIHLKSLHTTEKAGVLNAFVLVRTTEQSNKDNSNTEYRKPDSIKG